MASSRSPVPWPWTRRHGHHLVKAQVVELVHLHRGLADAVALVDSQDDGLVAAAQHVGHFLVRGGEARTHVHHHHDAVCGVDGDLGLLAHMGQDPLGGLGLDAAGVHQQQVVALPLAGGKNPVPGDAGGVSSTMARRWPHSLLNRVDLPTLGRPTTATMGLLIGCFLLLRLSAAGNVQPAAQQRPGLLAAVGRQDLYLDPQPLGQLLHRDAVQEHVPLAAQPSLPAHQHPAGKAAGALVDDIGGGHQARHPHVAAEKAVRMGGPSPRSWGTAGAAPPSWR